MKYLLIYCISDTQFQIVLLDGNEQHLECQIVERVCCFLYQYFYLILMGTIIIMHICICYQYPIVRIVICKSNLQGVYMPWEEY